MLLGGANQRRSLFYCFYYKLEIQGNIIVDQRHALEIWENYVYDRSNRSGNLEVETVETEEEVNEVEKGPCSSNSEVEKAIEEIKG
jgi:hypothetical protein